MDEARNSTPCGAVLIRRITVFVPIMFELKIYEIVSDLGMIPYSARVRWDLDASPRGISPRALAL